MLFLNNFEPFSYKEVILEYWVKKRGGGGLIVQVRKGKLLVSHW